MGPKIPYITIEKNLIVVLNQRYTTTGWEPIEGLLFMLDSKKIWYVNLDRDKIKPVTWDEAQAKAGDYDLIAGLAKHCVGRWEFDNKGEICQK
jgi:hypothetical protein